MARPNGSSTGVDINGTSRWLRAGSRVYRVQGDDRGVDQDFAGVLEIHRDAGAGYTLNLAETPIGLGGVADELAWFQVAWSRFHEARIPLTLGE